MKDRIRSQQHILLWSLVGLLSLGVVGLLFILMASPSFSPPSKVSSKSSLTTGSSRLDPKEVWVEKFTSEQEVTTKRLETLEKMLENLLKLNQSSASVREQSLKDGALQGSLDSSKPPSKNTSSDSVQDLRHDLKNLVQGDFMETVGTKGPQTLPPQKLSKSPDLMTTRFTSSSSAQTRFRSKGIQKTTLNLLNARLGKTLKTYDNTIPAGAFVRAVLLGGVDASTSIQAASDPRPVLLRLTDHGTLPRFFHSDLCGCHVLAASYGDISSERVMMRLEKLTCTERQTGEIIELNVQGYVAGEDGRAGLRGHVVDRSGETMRHAAMGGFLSGMGNFLSQSQNPIAFSPATGIGVMNPLTNGELLKYGAAKGASGALEKYADFYIKRAEQMQPVIQIQAGRMVDIVFTQGVEFSDSAVRQTLSQRKDQKRFSQIQSQDTSLKPLEAWVPKEGDPS